MDSETLKREGKKEMMRTPAHERLLHSKKYERGILVYVETCGQERTRVLIFENGLLVKTKRFEGERRVQRSIDYGERYSRQGDEVAVAA